MYRAQDDDPAAMFARARARHEALAKELVEKHQQAQLLSVQVMRKGGALEPIPPLPTTNFADAAALPPAALAGITAEVERATEQLEQRKVGLDKTITQLQARLDGGSVNATLGPAPRGVPFVYFLAEWLSLPFVLVVAIGGSVTFVLAEAVAPLRFAPAAYAFGAIVWSLVATMRRTRLLSHGGLPLSTSMEEKPGLGSYQNQRLTSCVGWERVAANYTGPRVKTHVRFVASDGSAGDLVIGGMPYKGGVILCTPGGGAGATARGMAISRFHCQPRPDVTGKWQASIGGAQWAGVAIGGILLLASLGSAGYATLAGDAVAPPSHKTTPGHKR
jgi:hypothetical protein